MSFINQIKTHIINSAKSFYGKTPLKYRVPAYRWNIRRRLSFPREFYIETTSACNLNCVMCPTQRPAAIKHKKQGFMSWELFCNLVDQLASENPYAAVRLHKDGEPLLHPDIVKFIDYASSRLHDVLLVTNATLLTSEMARSILSTRLQTIRFSVDGNTKQTFERIRMQSPGNLYRDPQVPVDYDSVIGNIFNFCEMKKSLGRSFPRVGMRITSLKATQSELADYVAFWEKLVDFVSIATFASWSGGQVYHESIDFSQRYPCIELWESMTINWDGTMAPCCVYVDTTGDRKGILADLNRITMKKAWQSSAIQRLRLAHLDNNFDDVASFCKSCSDWRISSAPTKDLWTEKFKNEMRSKAQSSQ